MWPFRKRGGNGEPHAGNGGTAVVERPVVPIPTEVDDDFDGTDEELFAEIDRLSAANAAAPDRDAERRLVYLRHLAGIRTLVASAGDRPEYPEADADALPQTDGLPEIEAKDLTPGLLRAGILRDGCVLVRGLVPRDEALRFADEIDRAFVARDAAQTTGGGADGYYEEFEAGTPFDVAPGARPWIQEGGGVLAVDAPVLTAQMLEIFAAAGLPELVGDYLGERPMVSLQKTTLRRADPSVGGAWHQDGAFMGEVRALNLWLSLSRCGDESPGLDLVPRRLDHLVTTTTDEAVLSYQVSQSKAEEAAGEKGILRPIFEPGDALFFDELFLHQTGSDPAMPKPRYAVESWFFGGSKFPGEYGPLVV